MSTTTASMMMTLAQAHALLPGSTLIGDEGTPILRVHTDTRTLRAGDLFVALKGDNFDAHDFIDQAYAAGAVAVIAQRGNILAGLRVADTQAGLEALGAAWRRRFALPLIAVTGSNGKTTVTQMIASILRAWHGEGAFHTVGNLNNHIGVPLTLLRLRQDDSTWHRAGVVELGMNHVGEIARLAAITQATVGLVNNAQREHQEFMASVEAVARENGSVIEALPASGTAVFPAQDEHTALWRALAGQRRVIDFGRAEGGLRVQGTWQGAHWNVTLETPAGRIDTTIAVPGEHNLLNAAASAACALAAGAPNDAIARGLAAFAPVKGRLQTHRITLASGEATLVDDSYNANPDSVRAAIDVLASLPAPRWLVLGDMGEVGTRGPEFHAEVGAYARERGIDHLWCAGTLCTQAAAAFGPGAEGASSGPARHFADAPAVIAALSEAPASASVLVKGSRFMAMERVVAALTGKSAGGAHAG